MADDPKSDRKAPGFWFYPADYERDVQILSLAAQGLWSRMLCWMSENEAHRGFLELATGEPMSTYDISAKVGRSGREIDRLISEMQRVGTFSRDERGCIFCRRMARESHIGEVRKKAAASRWSAAKAASKTAVPHPDSTKMGTSDLSVREWKDESELQGNLPSTPLKSDNPCEFARDFAYAKVDAKNMQNAAVSASVSVLLKNPPPALDAYAKSAVSPVSGRFDEFKRRWVEGTGSNLGIVAAETVWFGVVTPDVEDALFACLESYLRSQQVHDGKIHKASNWLIDRSAEKWETRWAPSRALRTPAPQPAAPKYKNVDYDSEGNLVELNG